MKLTMPDLPPSLLRLIPEVNDRVRAGSLDRNDARTAWESLEGTVAGKVLLVVLHGSVAAGCTRPYSDIDLLIVIDGGGPPHHLARCAAGYLVDVTILPVQSITEAAQRAGRSRLHGEVTGLLEGVSLVGDDRLLDRARDRVRHILGEQGVGLDRLTQGIEARLLGRLLDLAVAQDDRWIKALILDIHGLCASLAALRETGQLLPIPVVYQRLSTESRALLDSIAGWPTSGTYGLIEMLMAQFGFRTFGSWEQMLPE
jgi:predicted nucleotidyltransferase